MGKKAEISEIKVAERTRNFPITTRAHARALARKLTRGDNTMWIGETQALRRCAAPMKEDSDRENDPRLAERFTVC
jgi:hypothetical protein